MKTRIYATPAVKGLNLHGHAANVTHLNPLSPRDALKHHFKSLKTDFIFLQVKVLEGKFQWNYLTNT